MKTLGLYPSPRYQRMISILGRLAMSNVVRNTLRFAWSRLGNCRACIRSAWLATLVAVGFGFVSLLMGWRELFLASSIIALGPAGLWIAHLFAFASKLTISSKQGPVPALGASASVVDTLSRRDVLPVFMRLLLLGALVSVAPRSALAQSIALLGCGREPCTSDCTRPAYQGGQFLGCIGCHSCGGSCTDSPGSAFPNGC